LTFGRRGSRFGVDDKLGDPCQLGVERRNTGIERHDFRMFARVTLQKHLQLGQQPLPSDEHVGILEIEGRQTLGRRRVGQLRTVAALAGRAHRKAFFPVVLGGGHRPPSGFHRLARREYCFLGLFVFGPQPKLRRAGVGGGRVVVGGRRDALTCQRSL
jgi:hypothetical protein